MRIESILLIALAAGWLGCDARHPGIGPPSALATSALPIRQDALQVTSAPSRQITIFLPRLLADDSLRLEPVARTVIISDNPARDALQALVEGPTGDERAADLEYALDRRTQVLDVAISAGTAVASFGDGLQRVRGRPFSELVYWAIVYTLTQEPGVDRVTLRQNETPVSSLGDPPFAVPDPGTRDQAPDWARPR